MVKGTECHLGVIHYREKVSLLLKGIICYLNGVRVVIENLKQLISLAFLYWTGKQFLRE